MDFSKLISLPKKNNFFKHLVLDLYNNFSNKLYKIHKNVFYHLNGKLFFSDVTLM